MADLSRNNRKEWFHANKSLYEEELLGPAAAFVLALGPKLKETFPDVSFGTQRNGSGSIMRINRDIRFSPDKRPYKEHLGLVFWIHPGEGEDAGKVKRKKVELPCFYFHFAPERIFFYGGQHMFPKDILERYRTAVADEGRGPELEKILETLAGQGLPLMEEPVYKRTPRGYPADHPRGELLRLGGVGVATNISPGEAESPQLIESCAKRAGRMKTLIDWLCDINRRREAV